jgi:hypothetical protein
LTLRRPFIDAVSWFGVFGAPLAWAAQHVTGFMVATAACAPGGPRRAVAFNALAIIVTVPAVLVALAAIGSALYVYRATSAHDKDDPPPEGRLHFFSIVGLTVGPLFVFIMVMSGFGVIDLPGCRQS